ncbi:MAG: hypothetical protein RLZZ59_39 [Pseudomonadota bacterium]|jgi:predicted AAA+ superfamily ATPase
MLKRDIEEFVRYSAKHFRVVTITGPRQSGKTTLAKTIFDDKQYVSLEDTDIRAFASSDPRGFLDKYKDGAIIDEVQHCPDLFSYIQTKTDHDQIPGQYILTGSQNFLLMQNITQSLAGRAAIIHLLPFCYNEIKECDGASDIFGLVYKGFYPQLYVSDVSPTIWYRNYIRTYIERDIRQIQNIQDIKTFQTFLKICAGRVGQLVNFSAIGTECGVSHNTVRAWISILESSFIIHLLKPHHKNFNKRLTKQPKLYFYDTGLASALLGIESPEQLDMHYAKGALFENLIVIELIKNRLNRGLEEGVYFWRDNHGREIDILLDDKELIPIEVKASKTVIPDFFRNILYWNELSGQDNGYVVFAGKDNQTRDNIKVITLDKVVSI